MIDIKAYIQKILETKEPGILDKRNSLLEEFCKDEFIINAVDSIRKTQGQIMDKWRIKSKVADIIQKSISIPNGTVGKPYEAKLDLVKWGWDDVIFTSIDGLEPLGLQYDDEHEIIWGTPITAGDLKACFKFRIKGEPADSLLNEKEITIVINPDPKSLWKNLPSDQKDPYWKPDNFADFQPIGNNKHIVVASKRGRSHANVGSFRDDDVAYQFFPTTGWSLVTVSDGAGSARLSRKGSEIACKEVVNYFEKEFTIDHSTEYEELVRNYDDNNDKESVQRLNHFVSNHLSQAAMYVHKRLVAFADLVQCELKDLHSTLIFALFKQHEGKKYSVLTFSVGDCPIAFLNKDMSEVTLMNWLDVGEFGGGTRFITMPEVFSSEKFFSRVKIKIKDDFSFLMLLTDGIYDPKFVVEANLEKIEYWQQFIRDLQGENEDHFAVNFSTENLEIADQLSDWMDFWSVGNHDDRTLAIIF